MLRLAHSRTTPTSAAQNVSQRSVDPSLTADYLAFDRRRTDRRQYMKAFGGMALVVVLGALFGRVPMDEAGIVAALLLLPPLMLALLELIHWRRLVGRLDRVRANVKRVRKS